MIAGCGEESLRADVWVERCKMPMFRYFVFVGGALLALLLAVNFVLPQAPVTESVVASSNEQPVIRIQSDRKLPERVVLDTRQPTIAAPAEVKTLAAAPQLPAQPDPSAKTRDREAFAQFTPAGPKADAAPVKKAEAKPVAPKRRIARRSAPAYYYRQPTYYGYGYGQPTFGRPMVVAQQPHFGFFNTW